jgi:uncharacterized protein
MVYNINKELENYIENNIKTEYANFDGGHNVEHYNFVVNNCLNYAKLLNEKGYNIDYNMAYVVGAYHDYGIKDGRENHSFSSGKYLRKDENLKQFFNVEQIELMAQAVEDHSSHLEIEPRNIYGKIVADSDKSNTPHIVFSRALKYGLHNFPNCSKKQHLDRVYEHIVSKFGRDGYIKFWINFGSAVESLEEIRKALDNKEECYVYISELYDKIIKETHK